MTLRARLALSLVFIAAVLVVPLFVVRTAVQRLHADIQELRAREFQASLTLGLLRDALSDVRAREVAMGVVKSDTVHVQLQKALEQATRLSNALRQAYRDSASYRIAADIERIGPASEREWSAIQANNQELADNVSQGVMKDALRAADDDVRATEKKLRDRTNARVYQAELALADAEDTSLLALAGGLILAAIIAFWITRSVSGPVRALEKGMEAVANGELNHGLKIDTQRGDEFGRLGQSFEEMTRQLRELDKLKAEFVSIASHELKTPINVVLGYVALLQDNVYGPVGDKQRPVLKTIETQAKTLGRLASQLLDVSRFEAGGGRIEPRAIRLPAMLDDLENTFHVLAVQREVAFTVHRLEGLPDEVMWDPERINEVTGNLLSNAFKFTKSGGSVDLTAGPHEHGVCIQVKDTGAGIPPEQLKRVFEKFYQADNQKQASAKGTGLGLAIAKEIVEAHQGHITVDSTAGQGTTFTIILPLRVLDRRRSSSYKLVAVKKAGRT